tara:strand:+ start:100 stop:2013 length:1914 start_codon:yes stop_codon:yes gene_type:complete
MYTKKKSVILPFALVTAFLVLIFTVYQQGMGGDLFYDDLTNLSQLENVESFDDAKEFVLSGEAGPLGRPLSLITFIPHAGDWPNNTDIAILVNILIHIFNGILLLVIGYLALVRSGWLIGRQAQLASFMAMALWVSMPLLASTSLIIVQRMTSLASMFGLLGVLGYLLLSKEIGKESIGSLLFKYFVLFGFTFVAMFAKENAVVFPIYVLIFEVVLFARKRVEGVRGGWLSRIRIWGLVAYAALVVGYLLTKIPSDIFALDPQRGFSFMGRLATQPLILWDYIRLALFPSLNAYGPFHDDVQIVSNYGKSVVATAALLLVLGFGFYCRRGFPFLLVAVLWFFCGHLVESSVVMLEPYFEHRNYIAVYGIALMIACAVLLAGEAIKKVLLGAFFFYVTIQLMVLAMLCNIWGSPAAAAEHWANVKPHSSRAHMALSANYFRNLASPTYANTALDRGLVNCSDCLDMYMQSLIYGCMGEDEEKVIARYDALYNVAPSGKFTPALLDGFYPLRDFVNSDSCGTLDSKGIYILLRRLEGNPRFLGEPNFIHLTYLKAVIAADFGDWDVALSHLGELLSIRRIFGAVTLEAQILDKTQGRQVANEFLERIKQNPGNIGDVSRDEWDKRLQQFIDDMQAGNES